MWSQEDSYRYKLLKVVATVLSQRLMQGIYFSAYFMSEEKCITVVQEYFFGIKSE